jgi:hypothetical protein
MFARQLPDERFEAFLSFVQSLTEGAALVPHALIIGPLPESDAEAGGVKGKESPSALREGLRPHAVGLAAGIGRRDLRDRSPRSSQWLDAQTRFAQKRFWPTLRSRISFHLARHPTCKLSSFDPPLGQS